MIDQHIHSNISHDGKSSIKEHMEYAIGKGFKEITFTEHFDDYTGIETNLKPLDIENYKKVFDDSKDDNIIKINFGIEIGLRPESYSLISNIVKNNKFDFIIGSSHITCGKDMAYDESFFEGLTYYEAIMKYFNEVLLNIKMYSDEFDVYGHLDYVIRYIIKYYGNVITKIDYNEFKDILDEILSLLIKKGKGIEINTSGLRYGLEYPHPNIDILKRYKELGGTIVTIGSDAHISSDIGSDFNVAYDMLKEAGFDYIALYHNRIPEFVKIK